MPYYHKSRRAQIAGARGHGSELPPFDMTVTHANIVARGDFAN